MTTNLSIVQRRIANFDAWLIASGARHRWIDRQHFQLVVCPGDATRYPFLVCPPPSDDCTILSRGGTRQFGPFEGLLIGPSGDSLWGSDGFMLRLNDGQGIGFYEVEDALPDRANPFTIVTAYVVAALLTGIEVDHVARTVDDYKHRGGVTGGRVLTDWVEFGG